MNINNITKRLNEIIKDDDIVTDVVNNLNSISGNKLNESIEAIFKSNRTNKVITSFDEFVNVISAPLITVRLWSFMLIVFLIVSSLEIVSSSRNTPPV